MTSPVSPPLNGLNSVLLPLIRRVMPNIIAHDIIGFQPMGPMGPLGTAKIMGPNGWPGRVRFEKIHFRHFVRVYNRRNRHHPEYLTRLKYHHIKLSFGRSDAVTADDWCRATMQPGSWVRSHSDFWFANSADAATFTMRWL